MCKALKSVNIQSLTTVNEVFQAISDQLAELEEIAKQTDFSAPEQADQFFRNINYIGLFYSRAETIIRGL